MNIQVPAEPPRKAKKAEEKLSKLSGPDFDRAYTKIAADEQKQFVKELQREARNGRAAGVKEYATKNLPAEQERQKQAEELANTRTPARQK
jgi:putative membrane protein